MANFNKRIESVKVIITRLIFALHSLIALWIVTEFTENPYFWFLSCFTLLLIFESISAITTKTNKKWNWFCPFIFLYLSNVVPIIWLLKLEVIDDKRRAEDILGIGVKDLLDTIDVLDVLDTSERQNMTNIEIQLFFGVHINFPINLWITLIEQLSIFFVIIGRWILPKGDLTREQLSELLIAYIGTAADIIDFFEYLQDDTISREPVLKYMTLSIWTWSLMQFTIVLTTIKSRKPKLLSDNIITNKIRMKITCCSIDVWEIILNLIFQEGPFLIFRLILIIHYKMYGYAIIFFVCKNTLVFVTQLYRIYVIQAESKDKQNKKFNIIDLSNISVIFRDTLMDSNVRNKNQRRSV